MKNFYQSLVANPGYFRQFTHKELLFLNYDCPVKERRYDMWSEYGYFIYVISGKKVWETEDNRWNLTAGSCIFVKPGACIVEQYFEEPFCVLVFFLPESYISRFFIQHPALLPGRTPSAGSTKDMGELVIPLTVDQTLINFYESVLPYFSEEKNPPEELIELKFQELLINIFTKPSSASLRTYMDYLLQRPDNHLKQVMEHNFCYNLTLEDYARLCHKSLSTFKRDFLECFGETPGLWLLGKKLEKAKRLLANHAFSIAEICLECGFSNGSHFSRAFKKKFDGSPQSFRAKRESQPVLQ